MHPDLIATRDRLRSGATSAMAEMDRAIAAARSPACAGAFLRTRFDAAPTEAAQPALAPRPLAGLAVSVKDLFDVAGEVTSAGSVVLADAAPASADAPAVARVKAAGGVLIGRTHMTEFAFSGVGTNPHFATPANPCDAITPRIPGGSSSGAAVSVATGAAFIGLGSDTGGSLRIPAALCGLVGFKPTAQRVPTQGAMPLSTTLDSIGAITRTVRDAVLAHEVLADRPVALALRPMSSMRLAVPRGLMLDQLDPTVARAFERTLATLRAAGARIDDIDLPPLVDLPRLQAGGGFSAAESYAWHRELITRHGDRYDPRVRVRIERGEAMRAWEYLELVRARREWIAHMSAALDGYDAALSPTVPLVAPPIAEVAPGAERDEAFFHVNGLLLRNTSVVNLFDGCAISLPCHAAAELPVGLMAWAGPMQDDAVLYVGLALEAALASQREAA